MGKSRGKIQTERRLVDMTELPDEEAPWEPDRTGEHEVETIRFEFDPQNRLIIRRKENHAGLVTDFAVVRCCLVGGKWLEAARVDMAHLKTVHVDLLDPVGRKVGTYDLNPITCYADIRKGYASADRELMEGDRVVSHVANFFAS